MPRSFFRPESLLRRLKDFDLIVVAATIPTAFLQKPLDIERLRGAHPQTPIVNLSNFFLATQPEWFDLLRSRSWYGRTFGLERYDWYLSTTIRSPFKLPKGDFPFSEIGLDLDSRKLQPSSKLGFRALLDFPRKGFEAERKFQLEALAGLGVEYTELRGEYRPSEIYSLYSEHSVFFLSFPETFGLPIVENQLCGNLVFTPSIDWCPAHLLKDEQGLFRKLGRNFRIYQAEERKFKEMLSEAKEFYDPTIVRELFGEDYPDFDGGSKANLEQFIARVRSGYIHSRSHLEYGGLNSRIRRI